MARFRTRVVTAALAIARMTALETARGRFARLDSGLAS